MGSSLLTDNPFAVLTFIAAPAILTNASSVMVMSTINRWLRALDRMHELLKESQSVPAADRENFIQRVNHVERQAMMLLGALHWIYVAHGAFAAATLVTLLGAVAGHLGCELAMQVVIGLGLTLGSVGVAGLVGGCTHLFRATQLSLANIRSEAAAIRAQHAQIKNSSDNQGAA